MAPPKRQLVAYAFWDRILWDVIGSHLGNNSENLQHSVFQTFKSDKQFPAVVFKDLSQINR